MSSMAVVAIYSPMRPPSSSIVLEAVERLHLGKGFPRIARQASAIVWFLRIHGKKP
jgi:hypothetical protein